MKYRKSMDLVEHWVNTSGHGVHHEPFDQIFPVPSGQLEMSLSASRRELASCENLNDVTSSCQKYHNDCELYGTGRLKECSNVDGSSGNSPDHTHNDLGHMALMTQKEQPTRRQTRSMTKSLKSCTKILDSESGMLFTDKSPRPVSDSVNCNKTTVSRKNILEPAVKEISLRTCDQIRTPTGESPIGKKICELRNYNDSPAVRKEDLSVEETRSTSKQLLENHRNGSAAINTVPSSLGPTHAGAECTDNLTSGKKTFFQNGSEALETSNRSICKQGNSPIIEGVPCGKETLNHSDMTRPVKRKLWFDLLDTEDGVKNSGPNHSLLKENPVSGYRLEKDIDGRDTDVTLGSETFLCKTAAPPSGTESGIRRYGRRQKTSPFSDSKSRTRRNAHRYSKSVTAAKVGVVSLDCYTTVSGTEMSVEDFNMVSSINKERALISRKEVALRDYSGDPTVRKKRILTVDGQDSPSATEEILKDVECSSLSLVSHEGGENLESLQGIRNEKQRAAAGHIVSYGVRDPQDRRNCHDENPASKIEHISSENVISKISKSQESSLQGKDKKIFTTASVSCPTMHEDYVEQSVEDASTVIIYPLLSCRYENEVSKIRQKLNSVFENVKDKDRRPLLNLSTGKQITVLI
jgi:hypothetical protein